MERSLQELLAQRGFDALFYESPEAIYILGLDGRFLKGNGRVETLVGYTEQELFGMKFSEIVHPDDHDRIGGEFLLSTAGRDSRYRTRFVSRSGETIEIDMANIPLRHDDGTVAAIMGVVRDVGEIEKLARQSDQNEAILRIAGRVARVGGWSVEVATGELYTSDELNNILGTERSDSLHYLAGVEFHPEPHRTAVRTAMELCMTAGTPIDVTSVIHDTHGNQLDVRTVGEAVRNSAGEIVRIQGAFCDVSDIVRKERAAARVEQLLHTTLNQMETGIAFVDRDWRFTFVNDTGRNYMPGRSDVVVGETLWSIYPEREESLLDAAYRRAMDEGEVATARDFYPPHQKWYEITAYPTDEGIAIHLSDVTRDHEARIQLLETNERLRYQAKLLDSVRDAIVVRGLDNKVKYWNRGAEVLYGWSAAEVVGQRVPDHIHPDKAAYDQANSELLRDGYWNEETAHFTRDGRKVIVDGRWLLLFDEAGMPESVLVVDTDITAWMLEQERSNRAVRMESLGTLAGGMAHDLNNVLTPILMGAQLLARDEQDKQRLVMLQSIETGVKRGAEMIRQVLSFATGEEGKRHELEVQPLIDEIVTYCHEALPNSIHITAEVQPGLPNVMGDSTQLLQVLMNLVTNASHAMPGGGTMAIRGRAVSSRSGVDGQRVNLPGVVIEVEDSGRGMSNATALKVFEPFFTTKEHGKGTGLGLSTSLAIARSHGGNMEVYSEPGRGSRFQLHLPTAAVGPEATVPEGPQPAAAPKITPAELGGGELILVVDDESSIRQLACQTLEAHGYRTIQASDGLKAIELIEKRRGKVRLVLTDMMMPGVGGATTAAYLREHHPAVALIAASGLSGNQEKAQAAHPGMSHFLAKPFTAAELLAAVRDTIDNWETGSNAS